MKLPKFLKKFNIIDWLIIICIILAICFAFIYVATDDNGTESTSIDTTTMSKIGQKYSEYYMEGDIVNTTINGYNATSGKYITLTGSVLWEDDDSGAKTKLLIDSGGQHYLAASYDDVKNADIYIDKLTLDKTDQKYNNTVEVTISPMKVNTLSDLIKGIPNGTNYEISAEVGSTHKDSQVYQEITNQLYANHYRISIKPNNAAIQDQIEIEKATANEINIASNILGQIDGQSNLIKIRVYNCNNNTLQEIKNNYNVTNVEYVS